MFVGGLSMAAGGTQARYCLEKLWCLLHAALASLGPPAVLNDANRVQEVL